MLFKQKYYRANQYSSLIMKISEENLLNYIKFDENGNIIETKY